MLSEEANIIQTPVSEIGFSLVGLDSSIARKGTVATAGSRTAFLDGQLQSKKLQTKDPGR